MLIKSMMAPLMLCLIAALATPASARTLHHALHHQISAEYAPAFQPPMAEFPEGHVRPLVSPMPLQPRRDIASQRARQAQARVKPAQPAFGASRPSGQSFGGSSLVAEARRWMGGNPTGRSSLWCGNFMNFVLQRTGHPGSQSNQARSFASYGHRLTGPQVGAIAVMSRGRGGGHVGVVSGIDESGNPIIISGNHGHKVGEGVYSRSRIYAYVMP
jgi:uncharacterized protein (TIGR02594 family)